MKVVFASDLRQGESEEKDKEDSPLLPCWFIARESKFQANMKVTFKFVGGATFELDIGKSESISAIKARLEDESKVPAEEQR